MSCGASMLAMIFSSPPQRAQHSISTPNKVPKNRDNPSASACRAAAPNELRGDLGARRRQAPELLAEQRHHHAAAQDAARNGPEDALCAPNADTADEEKDQGEQCRTGQYCEHDAERTHRGGHADMPIAFLFAVRTPGIENHAATDADPRHRAHDTHRQIRGAGNLPQDLRQPENDAVRAQQ